MSVQPSILRNTVNLDESSTIKPLTLVFVTQVLQVSRSKGLEGFASSKKETVHPSLRLAQLTKTRDDLLRKPSSSSYSSSSSKKKKKQDETEAAAKTATLVEHIASLSASFDNDLKIYEQSAIARGNMTFTIKQKIDPALLAFYTDGEDLGTTVSISEFLESVINNTPKKTEDIEKYWRKSRPGTARTSLSS